MTRPAFLGPLTVLVAVLAAGAPAPAVAQSLFDDTGLRLLETTQGRFTLEGQVSVTFRGEGVEGTIVHRPIGSGTLRSARLAVRGVQRRDTSLSGFGRSGATTVAHVVRTAPDGTRRRCTDARPHEFSFVQARAGQTTLPAVAPRDLRTRCGGPLAADLAAALPALPVGSALARGDRTIDLTGERPFTAGGLTGSVRSSLVLRLGDVVTRRVRPPRSRRAPSSSPVARFTVVRVSGLVSQDLAVPADAVDCEPLDLCGLTGRQEIALATPPFRSVLALQRRGTTAFGFADLGAGALTTRLRRPDGSTCADDAPSGTLVLDLAERRGGVRATLTAYDGEAFTQTRCAAPGGDVVSRGRLATTTVPRSVLDRRTFTLRLRADRTAAGPLARGRARGDVSIVLRRQGG